MGPDVVKLSFVENRRPVMDSRLPRQSLPRPALRTREIVVGVRSIRPQHARDLENGVAAAWTGHLCSRIGADGLRGFYPTFPFRIVHGFQRKVSTRSAGLPPIGSTLPTTNAST